jgi:hypothetical protein
MLTWRGRLASPVALRGQCGAAERAFPMVIPDFLSPRPAPSPGDFVSQAKCKYGALAVKP